jgi:hypothetical protein
MRAPVNTAGSPRPPRPVKRPTHIAAPLILREFEHDPLRRPEFSDAKFFTPFDSTRVLRPSRIDPIALMLVYIDTEQVFLRSIEDTDRQRIKDAYHDGGEWFVKEIKQNFGSEVEPNIATTGYQVKMQHPQPAALGVLADLAAEARGYNRDLAGSMTRQDFAIDFLPLGGRTEAEVDRYIFGHLIQPNRRPGPLFRYMRNTTYWNKNAHQRQHSRDIVHYPDKLPKLPLLGSRPISHLDLRSRGSRTIQADGFETLADAMNADPIEIVRRSLYFTDVDIRPHAEAEALASHEHFSWRLQSRFIHMQQLHTAQRVKEVLNIAMPPDPFPPLLILPRLIWL